MEASTVSAVDRREAPAPGCSRLRLEVVTEPVHLEKWRSAWSALLERSLSNEPMLSPTWLLMWWQIYGQGRQLRVGLFHDGDRLVGLAPLQRRRFWYRPGIPFWRLEPLGADVAENDGVCSDYLNVVCEAGYQRQVADALAGTLWSGAFGKWHELLMPAMDGENPMVPVLGQALSKVQLTVACSASGSAPFILLPKTWEEYLQSLAGRKRYVVTRSLRDFERWAGKEWQLHEVRTQAELAEGCRILQSLHNERWQEGNLGGAFHKPRFQAFHDAVMPRLLEEGRLELLWLTVQGEAIAALYNVVANNKVYFYQCGRKMDVPQGQRPGIVILALAIQRAIAAGRREFDFLAGPSQYKGQLAPLARPLVQVRAVRPCLRERLRCLAHFSGDRLRRLVRKTRSVVAGFRQEVPGDSP